MRMKNQLEYRNNALMQLRNLYFGVLEYESKKLYEEKDKIYQFLKERKVPERMIDYIRGYEHGLFDLFMKERVIFLYNVNGQLYKLKENVEIDLPVWDTLPREMWTKLGELGGFYYRKSLKKYS